MAKKKEMVTIRSSAAEYLTYIASTGDTVESVEIRYEDENIWLTQKMMAVLYDVGVPTINHHVQKIYDDNELMESSTIRKFRIVQNEGNRQVEREVIHYSVQMIIAVGFKVNSERAVQFRKWVNTITSEYTIKGFVMDDERLKKGTYLTDKYFDEQLERIREIRASERRFYQKITDLYATAIDYDRDAKATKRFYATVQNKMHFAVHGCTVAKNYLTEFEMSQLNRMVTAYLDFAEDMAIRKIPLTMEDWENRLNSFIELFQHGLLKDAGKVSAEIARIHAETEFEKYRIIQDQLFESDYDRFIREEGNYLD